MYDVREKVTAIKGVGDKTAEYFSKIGVNTIGELLYHYPFRYETFATPIPISKCIVGTLCAVEGIVITSPKLIILKGRKIIEMTIKDDTGSMTIKWFNAPYLLKAYRMGDRLIFRGKVNKKGNFLSMVQPTTYKKEEYRSLLKTYKPVYPTTEGLSQNMIGGAIKKALEGISVKEYIPAGIRTEFELCGIKETLMNIHYPVSEEMLKKALNRLVFDEFFMFMLNMRVLKGETTVEKTNVLINRDNNTDRLINNLGFELTDDQNQAINEIFNDMSNDIPMQRLLQGDVGSGKTAVALIALAAAAFNGYQGCIMAPTEVLAAQHYEYFKKMLEPMGITVGRLIGSMKKSEKDKTKAMLLSGEMKIIVGTHAAIQNEVNFNKLGLVVIDEQHRFGVRQREALELKGEKPHLLLMSATPIPRTYALMLYGDMDVSVIKQLPKGRLPIKNLAGDESMRDRINKFILKEIAAGHQAYVICSLVEESEKSTAAAVTTYTEDLQSIFGDNVKVEALHGRMKAAEKAEIMGRFERGETKVLVSTTVIEVGVNVPNATVMLIENAENFGLAQLHQIRGRVGRGSSQSYCIFMAGKTSENTKKRLEIIANSNDGFYIASQDMKLRGPGDFFGVRQSGDMQFIIADPTRDGMTLNNAKIAADSVSDEECKKILELRNNIVSSVQCMVY